MSEIRVLFVCLGNICRSPTAEAIFRHQVERNSLGSRIFVDSAGTGDWHVGKAPDRRAREAASARGYRLDHLRARQVSAEDFTRFDYILAMDETNLANLEALRPGDFAGHLGLFLDFADYGEIREVPDPYFGGQAGFELVLDLIENGARRLLTHIHNQHLGQ